MSVKAILTEQQKSYTKAEEDALLSDYYNKDYIDTYMAPLDTPTFVGQPKAPTAAAGTNTTQIATTAFVHDGLQRKVNPNLLRNWYFVGGGTGRGVFPVNSRGLTTYTNGYIIDGWVINSGSTITLSSSGMNVQGAATYTNLNQYVDSPTSFSNQTLTLSILISSASSLPYVLVYSDSSTEIFRERIGAAGLYSKTFTADSNGVYRISLNSLAYSVNYTIQAIKLELGDQQTLCHQENGVWVFNEIPDYEEEYYRCITSTTDGSDTYANKTLATTQEIAPVENGTTASRAYAAGEYFCWHGSLCKASTAINVGDTLTENTNCYLVNVGNELNIRGKFYCTSRYAINTGTVINHVPKKDCIFMILTYAVNANGTYANGAYFGFVSMLDTRYSRYSTLFTPASSPCSIAFEPGIIKITTSIAYVRVVVLEFPDI